MTAQAQHPLLSECIDHGRKGQPDGYATVRTPEGLRMLHRKVYADHAGVPEDSVPVVRHRCDNRRCINPLHLEPGTQADNMRDMVERGRSARGTKQHLAVLTDAMVLEARRQYIKGSPTHGLKPLAKMFNVSVSALHAAISGTTWRHI